MSHNIICAILEIQQGPPGHIADADSSAIVQLPKYPVASLSSVVTFCSSYSECRRCWEGQSQGCCSSPYLGSKLSQQQISLLLFNWYLLELDWAIPTVWFSYFVVVASFSVLVCYSHYKEAQALTLTYFKSCHLVTSFTNVLLYLIM